MHKKRWESGEERDETNKWMSSTSHTEGFQDDM